MSLIKNFQNMHIKCVPRKIHLSCKGQKGIYQYPGRYFDTPKNSNEFDHIMFRQHKKWFNLLSSRIVGLGAITEGG
jgi:hypothetical protein